MKNNNLEAIENKMAKSKVAMYLRIGNNDIEQLKLQEKVVRDYCDKKGYEVALSYIDVNTRANENIKDGLEQLFNDIQNKEIGIIIIRDLSRLSRNIFDLYDYINYAEEYCNCNIETVTDGYDYKFDFSLKNGSLDYESKVA